MNNRPYTLLSPSPDFAKTHSEPLISDIEVLRDQTADAIYEVDRQAMFSGNHSLRCYMNGLGTGLVIIAAQLEYYFPDGCDELELGEWRNVLAVFNSACQWFEEQLLEIHLRLGPHRLTEQLRDLAQGYNDILPDVIAARCTTGRPEFSDGVPAWSPLPPTTGVAQPAKPAALAFSH